MLDGANVQNNEENRVVAQPAADANPTSFLQTVGNVTHNAVQTVKNSPAAQSGVITTPWVLGAAAVSGSVSIPAAAIGAAVTFGGVYAATKTAPLFKKAVVSAFNFVKEKATSRKRRAPEALEVPAAQPQPEVPAQQPQVPTVVTQQDEPMPQAPIASASSSSASSSSSSSSVANEALAQANTFIPAKEAKKPQSKRRRTTQNNDGLDPNLIIASPDQQRTTRRSKK